METQLIAAFIIGVLSVARLTRLVVDDDWPPVAWMRDRYLMWLVNHFGANDPTAGHEDGGRKATTWYKLVECGFCFSVWPAIPVLALGWLSYNGDASIDWWWWLPNAWLGGAYLSAILVARDIPEDARAGE